MLIGLDIDGVMNREDGEYSYANYPWNRYEPSAVEALNWLTEQAGAELVVTSQWRLRYTHDQTRAGFVSWGIRAVVLGAVDGDCMRGTYEEQRVARWRRWHLHHGEGRPYVLLDDADLSTPWLVRTDPHVGLTMQDAKTARVLLGVHAARMAWGG